MTIEPETFPTLDATDVALIAELGARRRVSEGEYLYREGDVTYDFFVLVSAEVDIVVTVDGGEKLIVHHGPGRFLGELNMLSGLRVFVSARVVKSGEVVVVPRDRLRQVMATKPQLGNTILAAFVARRALLQTEAAPAIRVIGSQFSPESLRVREFLARTRVPHEWLDPDRDSQAEGVLRGFGIAANELPVVIVTGSVLRRPTPGELASYLGLTIDSLPERCFDLVVVGGGPAGLAAAVYGASEGLRTLGVDMTAPGGQAGTTSRIENYLGFPMGISGSDLTQAAVIQAEKFGANLTVPCTAASLHEKAGHLVVRLSDGSDVAGRAVIAASGAAYRRLEASRLSDFEGKRCVLRRHRDGVTHVRHRTGHRRRWRQLRRAGGDLLEPKRVCGDARHPRIGPEQEHVALSGRARRGGSSHRSPDGHDGRRPGRRRDPALPASRGTRR